MSDVRKPWVAPRTGGYTPTGAGPVNPQPPAGPGAVTSFGCPCPCHRMSGVSHVAPCCNLAPVSLPDRAQVLADAEAAWVTWDDTSAEPFRDMARYGFIAGFLAAKGIDQ